MRTFLNVAGIVRLSQEPETVKFHNGGEIVKLSIAWNTGYQRNGEWVNVGHFMSCAVIGEAAQALAKSLKKGQAIHIEGSLEQESWYTQDEQKRTRHVLKVFRITDLLPKEKQVMADKSEQLAPKQEETVGTTAASDGDDIPF